MKNLVEYLNEGLAPARYDKRERDERREARLAKKLDAKVKTLEIFIPGYRLQDEDKWKFVSSFIYSTKSVKDILNEIPDNARIECNIKNRYAEGWRVFYSGTITVNDEEYCEFNDIDNGFARNLD